MTTEPISRTADRMWHDVFLPDDVLPIRAMAREAVATHLAPVAREIAQREESVDSFPWSAFKGLAGAGCFAVPFERPYGAGLAHPILQRASSPRRSRTRAPVWPGYTTGNASSMPELCRSRNLTFESKCYRA